jgi:hypothetical protein
MGEPVQVGSWSGRSWVWNIPHRERRSGSDSLAAPGVSRAEAIPVHRAFADLAMSAETVL